MEKPFPPGIQILLLFGLTMMMGVLSQVVFGLVLMSFMKDGVGEAAVNDPWLMLSGALFFQLFAHFAAFFIFLRITGLAFRDIIFFQRLKPLMLLALPGLLVVCFAGVEAFSYISYSLFENAGGYSFIEAELQYQQMLTTTFTHTDPLRLVLSIFVVAIVPAVGEELVYRGILFTRLIEATSNVHFSALISGIIFAAMHSQPLQILPIAAMGVALAYIYYYTRNIWYNILLHFLINGVQLLLFYFWPELMG